MDAGLAEAIASGRRMVEETVVNGERVLLVNQEEARDLAGRRAPERGAVMTLRDRSELQACSANSRASGPSATPSVPRPTSTATGCTPCWRCSNSDASTRPAV